MWTIEKYKEVYARYESSGLSVEQFCMNERIVRSCFYYWRRKYRKLPDKSKSIEKIGQTGDSRQESGFIPVWIAPVAGGVMNELKGTSKKEAPSPQCDQRIYMEISYANGTTVRLGGERDLELVNALILLSR